jgi:hypothetical protein
MIKNTIYAGRLCSPLLTGTGMMVQREQRQLDLQVICFDVDITTPSQYMKRFVGVSRQ